MNTKNQNNTQTTKTFFIGQKPSAPEPVQTAPAPKEVPVLELETAPKHAAPSNAAKPSKKAESEKERQERLEQLAEKSRALRNKENTEKQEEQKKQENQQAHSSSAMNPARPRFQGGFSPKRVVSSLSIEIHTKQAHAFLTGRKGDGKKHPIQGLFKFSSSIGRVIQGATLDDPWADLTLIKIEESLDIARAMIRNKQELVHDFILDYEQKGIQVDLLTSAAAKKVYLDFVSAYPTQLSVLIKEFDNLVRAFLPLKQAGLIDNKTWFLHIYEAGKPIRRVLNGTMGYRYTGISRKELLNGTSPISVEIIKEIGKVPDDILLCKKLPALAPKGIHRYKKKLEGTIGLKEVQEEKNANEA